MPSANRSRGSNASDIESVDRGRAASTRLFGALGLVLIWLMVEVVAYLGMFACRGSAVESGCEFGGFSAGLGFVAVATGIGTICLTLNPEAHVATMTAAA